MSQIHFVEWTSFWPQIWVLRAQSKCSRWRARSGLFPLPFATAAVGFFSSVSMADWNVADGLATDAN